MKTWIAFLALMPTMVFGYGMGQSSYPMSGYDRMITGEFTGVTSTGGGVGLQARFTQNISSKWRLDAGAGLSGGKLKNRVFIGSDYEIYPDYVRQPKVSVRSEYENAKEFGIRRHVLKVAPQVSKGFNFWGAEAFPYLATPIGLSLENDSKTFQTFAQVALGISGNIPIEQMKKFIGTLEANIKVKDSYSGIFLGLSYPIK